MSRIRTIKPEFWSSAQVMECSPNARLLFIGIWNFADDYGRFPASPRQLKALIFPGDDFSSENVQGMLTDLSVNGLLLLYDHSGKAYLQVTGWHHQKIEKRGKPKYPDPPVADPSPTAPQPFGDRKGCRISDRDLEPTQEQQSGEVISPPCEHTREGQSGSSLGGQGGGRSESGFPLKIVEGGR